MNATSPRKHLVICSTVLLLLAAAWYHPASAAADSKEMFTAVRSGLLAMVKLALNAGVEVNSRDEYGNTPLILAVKLGKDAIAEYLIQQGADVKASNTWGETPLILASYLGNPRIATLLLASGADLSEKTPAEDGTPLFWAVDQGHVEMVELLISKGADVNERYKPKLMHTPLQVAVRGGHADIARLLIEKGADKYEDGGLALAIAKAHHQAEIAAMLKSDEKTNALVEAARSHNLDQANRLLTEGATIDDLDDRGETALTVAAAKGYADIVRVLLDRGARVDRTMHSGETALMLTVRNGSLAVATMLVQAGADTHLTNRDGRTALGLAIAGSRYGFIQLLGRDTVRKVLEDGKYELMNKELFPTMLWGLEPDQLRLLRNTIYARYGYRFKSKDLQQHFSRFPWYSPAYANVDDQLTNDDRTILEYILWLEGKYGSQPPTDERLRSLLLGFWTDIFPVPDASAGYTFQADGTYQYRNPWNWTGSDGKWKVERKRVFLLEESSYHFEGLVRSEMGGYGKGEGTKKVEQPIENPHWEALADFTSYRPPWNMENAMEPPTMRFGDQVRDQVFYKLH